MYKGYKMKKSYAKLFILVSLCALCSCKKSETEKKGVFRKRFNQTSAIKKDIDTVRVTGVYDVFSGKYYKHRRITCVDNQGNEDNIKYNLHRSKSSPMRGAEYIERGDTLVLKGDTLVKNITRERIKSEFVKVKS
jgi:hypothetical protein